MADKIEDERRRMSEKRQANAVESIDSMRREIAALDATLEMAVRRALSDGVPVAKVAAALGVSRQAVHERYVKKTA